jgi:ribosomal protein S18 acetylase RimI-like enzyme
VETGEHKQHVRELFWEYLQWANLMAMREFDVSFDVNTALEQDLAKLHQFSPPKGRLLLGEWEGKIVGCACLRKTGEDVAEIKRMYVRPEYRRRGVARSLLEAIINEARQSSYSKIRLDSAPFAREAQALYRELGFHNIEPYAESEIPEKYRSHWVFMEMALN